jgi:putative lipoic acid-binding regulatory protein
MSEIVAVVRKYYPNTEDNAIKSQPSKQGNFLAISILLHVLDQATLDALYTDLSKHPAIKMVL